MKRHVLSMAALAAALWLNAGAMAQTVTTLESGDMPRTFTFEEETDDADYWSYANGSDGWVIGSAAYSDGSRGLYVSNDGGTSNAYSANNVYSYAWLTLDIEESGEYEIAFDWRCQGEPASWGGAPYDYMQVYLAPASATPTAGQALAGATQLGGYLVDQSSWQHFYTTHVITDADLGEYKLVFMWRSDVSGTYSYPGAIDNLYVGRLTCPAPTALAVLGVSDDLEASASWTPVGSEGAWQVLLDGEEVSVVSAPQATVGGLEGMTTYTLTVRAVCGEGDTSMAISTRFTTPCVGYAQLPFSSGFEDLQTGDMPDCWLQVQTGTNTTLSPNPVFPSAYRHSPNAHNSDVYFEFESNQGETEVLALPRMEDIANLQLSFYASIVNHNFMLEAGVIEYDDDGGYLFVPVDTVDLVAGSSFASAYRVYNVLFNTYEGSGERIAIRTTPNGSGTYTLMIDDFSVIYAGAPVLGPFNPATRSVEVGSTLGVRANLMAGSEVEYTWTSTMQAAGNAEFSVSDQDSAIITYSAVGIDSLTVVASTAAGADTATLVVYVVDYSPITEFPYATGFEDGEDISFRYANNANGWYIGTAVAADGVRSMYVSSTHGATNEYTNQASAYSYATRQMVFPQAGEYALSFDWRCQGDNSANLRVYLQEGEYSPAAGSYPSGTSLVGNLLGHADWQHSDAVLDVDSGLYTLVFCWYNYYLATSNNPAAAVDNLSISRISCSSVGDLEATAVYAREADLGWTPRSGEAAWLVQVDDGETYLVDSTSIHLTGLEPESEHVVSVKAVCGEGDTSFASTVSFTTTISCPVVGDIQTASVEAGGATLQWEAGGQEGAWVVYLDGEQVALVEENEYTFTDLDANTAYTAGIRAYCDEGDTSAMRTFRFRTACASGNCQFTVEAYDSNGDGWDGGAAIYVYQGGEQVNTLRLDGYVGQGTLQASHCLGESIELKWHQGSYDNEISFAVKDANGDEFAVVDNASSLTEGQLIATFGEDCEGISHVGEPTPGECSAPQGLTVSDITSNSATFSWTAGSSTDTEWTLTFNGSTLTLGQTSYEATGLAANTMYLVSVATVCADGEQSAAVSTSFTTLGTEGIGEAGEASFSLLPNPATASVTLAGVSQGARVRIVDMNGSVVRTLVAEGTSVVVDLHGMAAGAYFVSVSDSCNVAVRKLIVK